METTEEPCRVPCVSVNKTVEPNGDMALCGRPDGNAYFAAAWGDCRDGGNHSDLYYSTQGCRYTVGTYPVGLNYTVDDVMYSSEHVFSWPAGFQHTLIATDPGSPFLYWDDGTIQWFTATITPTAFTSDVSMTAYYFDSAIPEFPLLALPVVGITCIVLLSKARRLR